MAPSHHVAKPSLFGPRFICPWGTFHDPSFKMLMKFGGEMRKTAASGTLTSNQQPSEADFKAAFPVVPANYAALSKPPSSAVQALWIGHASLLIQMEGLTFLTDPIFSDRCSPFQFAGPKRVVPPAIEPDDPNLPHIDFVLISHNHYDHLDTSSVQRLHKRYGDGLKFYVPLGLKAWFSGVGVSNCEELDWWEEVQHPSLAVKICMTPAQHWSARGILDRRHTLWGGYAVLGANTRFWFAGDTGYCQIFKEIGTRYGPFDLAAIPTGAYEPNDFMKPQHVNPEEALQIHEDVQSRNSIAIHCCTFKLTLEPLDEPPVRLASAVRKAGLEPSAFLTIRHGEIIAAAGGKLLNSPQTLGQ